MKTIFKYFLFSYTTMKCPYCSSTETKVVDKRESEDEEVTRRRRQCLKCEKRFTTYERLEATPLVVVKKDGTRERFDRNKILAGIQTACEKRPITQEDIKKLIDKIESSLLKRNKTEISSKDVGVLVMNRLRKLDEVAYVRFASVYRQFTDAQEFLKEIQEKLLKK